MNADEIIYRQRLIAEVAGDSASDLRALITLQPDTPLSDPKRIGDRVVLEPGSPVVWFTFPGLWHDIGAFHLCDGTFTGLYANILTPVELGPRAAESWIWTTTDLILDLWLGADSAAPIELDRDEFDAARASLPEALAQGAEAEVARLLAAFRNNEWPPPVVGEWPLARITEQVRDG